MKCLVIANEQESSLSTEGDPRLLLPVLGVPLIERVILTAKKVGLIEFYVVSGPGSEKMRLLLDRFGQKRDVNITHIPNEEWEKRETLSLPKTGKMLDNNFILLLGDHILDESILARLKNDKAAEDEVILAVDYDIRSNKLADVESVTKVLVEDHSIRDIGKDIKRYNAYTTGALLCSPGIFTAIEGCSLDTKDSLSAALRVMAQKGKAKAIDIKDSHWMAVNTPADVGKATKLLYRMSAKPAGPITSHIYAKFATWIFTPLLLKAYKGFTPNQVSVLSFAVAILSGLSFVLGHSVVGGVLILISSILDYSDGQMARLKHMESRFGHFIDTTLDRYADGFILLGMLHYCLSQIGGKNILGIYWIPLFITSIGVLTIVGNLMVSYTSATSVVNFGYVYKRRGIAGGRGRDIRLFYLSIGGIISCLHPISVLLVLLVMLLHTNVIVVSRIILSWNIFSKESTFRMIRESKAIIFDFDGTVANTMPFLTELALKLITANYSISREEAKRRYLETTGMDFASQLEASFPHNPNNQNVAATYEERKLEGIFDHPIFPDAIPTLKYFRGKKIKRFICSSTKKDIVTRYCQLNKIDVLIDNIFGYEPDFKKGGQIDFIIQHYDLQPDRIILVADSLKDYDFAKEKRINFIAISRLFEKREFEKRGALSVGSLSDLTRLFETSENYLRNVEQVK